MILEPSRERELVPGPSTDIAPLTNLKVDSPRIVGRAQSGESIS